MNRFLLCTDLDRTLIPNGAQPESTTARERFKRLVSHEEVSLAYVTGRHQALIEQAIADYDLPHPDIVIADVGTTIYQIDSSGWKRWDQWETRIAPDWRGLSQAELHGLLGDFTDLQLQEQEKQNRNKLSFYLPLETNRQTLFAEMNVRLLRSGIRANLIWSVDEKAGIGLLDVLPASANKLHAIRFLMGKLGFVSDNTVFAGDSGNDLEVLMSDIPSTLVSNAEDRIRSCVAQADTATIYIAKGGYLGMNGNYCAGILEGVAHYWPEVDHILREMNVDKGC